MRLFTRRLRLSFVALALLPLPAAAVADERDMYGLAHGAFLAAHHRHAEAADIFAEIGRNRRDAKIMEAAVQSAFRAAIRSGFRPADVGRALQYANLWLAYGGGVPARQVMAELFIVSDRMPEAERILAELMENKEQSEADLYRQLSALRHKSEALAPGRRLFPQNAEGQFYLARLAWSAGDTAAERAALNRALQHDSARIEFHLLNAYLTAREKNNPAAALPVLESYVANNCHDAAEHCVLPAVLAGYAGYLGGNADWRNILNTPAEKDWRLAAGILYEQWDMPDRAKAEYEQLPGDFNARLRLAHIAEKEKGAAAALKILQNTPVEDDNLLISREVEIARLLQKTAGTEAALAHLQKVRQAGANDLRFLYSLSLLLEENNQIREALDVLKQITILFPDRAVGWNALGYVMADHNIDLTTAEKHIERALLMRPDDPNIIDSMGWVHYRLGKLMSALRHLEKASALSNSAEIAAHLGEVLWELGDFDGAKKVWRAALAREPDNKVLNAALRRYNPF